MKAVRREGPTFGEVALEWWELVEAGTHARRRGRAKKLAASTITDYRGVMFASTDKQATRRDPDLLALMDRCGRRPIVALDDAYWQSLVDELVRSGKSYSRIATYLAVIRHVYAYARRANRRLVPADPTRDLEMPANDGKPRERVATKEEAAALLAAVPAVDLASAFNWDAVLEIRRSPESAVVLSRRYGVSDSEIGRAQWTHVFWDADEIMVAASKSEAGEGRRIPMVGPLKTLLRQEWMRQGQPKTGSIVTRSVTSGKWQARADEAWEKAKRDRITLHEARHTYASFLMAAGYNLKQIQEYLGHADLATTARYIKNLPVPRGTTERAKLEAYLATEIGVG